MSCTVVAVSSALFFAINSFGVGLAVMGAKAIYDITESSEDEVIQGLKDYDVCEDIKIISDANFLEKSLETPFMDKDILLKTLEEHGVQNITEEWGKISGNVENYSLSFEKMEEDKPYFLKINYLQKDNPEEKLNDLSSEYALNVQEDAYLNIIEKLKENNMEIEDEEVLDDNTIVLTVNLEG